MSGNNIFVHKFLFEVLESRINWDEKCVAARLIKQIELVHRPHLAGEIPVKKKDIYFPGENVCVFTFCDIKVRDKKIGNSEQIMQPSHSGSFWTKRYKKYETCHGTFSIIIEFARILMFVANTLKVHKITKSCFLKKRKNLALREPKKSQYICTSLLFVNDPQYICMYVTLYFQPLCLLFT